MKICLACFSLFIYTSVFALWVDLNTGITDDLTGVTIWGTTGAASGHNGIYYSYQASTIGVNWTRFDISNNTADSILYNNTRFNHCLSNSLNSTYFCGEDTVNNQAVLVQIDLQTLSYSIIYVGSTGAGLNKIFHTGGGNYIAVGNSGLVVNFGTGSVTVIPMGLNSYDLTSFGMFGSNYWFGCNGARIKGAGALSSMNYSIIPTSHDYKDLIYTSSNVAYAVGNGYFRSVGSSTPEITNYNYGALNGNSVFLFGSSLFVGTDHGIFSGPTSSPSYLEWQPTSNTEFINEFWKDPLGSLYACGKNGVILLSNDLGGASQPYISITSEGGCVNTNVTVSEVSGSSTSCAWYLDGNYINSSCGSFTYFFTTVGTYELKMKGYNSGLVDSSVININIVDPPAINLLSSVADTVLCQSEPIEITINSTESNVHYSLFMFGNLTTPYSAQTIGNGGSITFNSSSLNDPGPYYIIAKSTLAACASNFTDSIELIVENTQASIHVGNVNSALGEDVYFYQNCIDAQNYEWNFTSNANTLTSNQPDPIIQYNGLGNATAQLICWSNEGCYDSTQTVGPVLYMQPTNVDSCWTNYTVGGPYVASGTNLGAISDAAEVDGGFLTVGSTFNQLLRSQHGSDLSIAPEGSYLAKYDEHGTIKWYAHAVFGQTPNPSPQNITSVIEDSNGDIYICGSTSDDGVFYDNSGQILDTDDKSFIIKLDSKGEIIWTLTADEYNFKPSNLSLDNQNNLLVTADLIVLNQPTQFNGAPGPILAQLPQGTNAAIVKFDSNGQFIWEAGIDGGYIVDVESDIDGNVYVLGNYVVNCYVISSNSNILNQVSQSGFNGWTSKLFYAKLNANGQFIWGTYSTSVGSSQPTTQAAGMVMDSLGNGYITGSNEAYWQGYYQSFMSSDSTFLTLNVGNYFIAKIDSTGKWQWANGAGSAYYAFGSEVALNEQQNEIITSGALRNNDQIPVTNFTFSGQFSNNITAPLGRSDLFIAKYDTSGILKKVCTNGLNPAILNNPRIVDLFYKNDSTYFLARRFNAYNGNNSYSNFNDSIPIINQQTEDYIAKFRLDCATCYCPNIPTTIENVSVCYSDDYTFPDGFVINNITVPTNHTFSVTTTEGCDSTIQVNVDLFPHESSYQENICSGDSVTFPDGNVIPGISQDLTYTSVIPGSNGCDSTITTFVSVYNLTATAIEDNLLGLVAMTSGSYQWLDCDSNYSIIFGATDQIFLPTVSGNYAVQVSASNCVDTSDCLLYSAGSAGSNVIETLSVGNQFIFFPNPTTNQLSIYRNNHNEDYSLTIYNSVGKVVLREERIQTEIHTINLEFPSGSYWLEFYSSEVKSHGKLIVVI